MVDSTAFQAGILGNYDIHITPELARGYPKLRSVVDSQHHSKAFARFDTAARKFKRLYIRLGLASVGLAFIALEYQVLASASRLGGTSGAGWHNLVFSAVGVAAIVIAGGIFASRLKVRWLSNVYARESIRLWRHQLLLDGRMLDLSESDPDRYREAIGRRWAELMHRFAILEGSLQAFLASKPPLGLFHGTDPPSSPDLRRDVLALQRILRLDYQLSFAKVKESEGGLAMSPRDLTKFSEWLATTTLVGALIMVGVELVVSVTAGPSSPAQWTAGTAGVVLALASAAIRAIRDGLTIPLESDSYREYTESLVQLHRAFDNAQDDGERWSLLARLEQAALVELHRYLTMKAASRFIV